MMAVCVPVDLRDKNNLMRRPVIFVNKSNLLFLQDAWDELTTSRNLVDELVCFRSSAMANVPLRYVNVKTDFYDEIV